MRVLFYIILAGSFCRSSRAQEAASGAEALAASASLSGYVSSSYHFGSGSGAYPFALSPINRNAFSLNVIGLSLHKPLDEWLFDSGFRVDLWAGPDASRLDTGSSDSTVEIRNAFLDLRIPIADPLAAGGARSIDLRIGSFDSPLGYESLDRNRNPHFSHSWGFTIEPTVHTGLLAMYPGVDVLENGESDFLLSLGVANSVDPQMDGAPANTDRKSFLAGLTWLVPEGFGPLKGTALSAGYVNGRTRAGTSSPVQNLYLAAGLPLPSDAWTLAFTYDARVLYGEGNDDSVAGAHLSYQANEKLRLNLRGELFQEGSKLFSSEGPDEQSDGRSLTATAQYQLWEHVLSRVEYRWDHTDSRLNGRFNSQAWCLNLIYNF